MTRSPMTPKQEALILSLARKLDGGSYRFVTEADHLLPISRSAARSMSRTDASLCIDHLQTELDKAELAREQHQAAPTAAVEGGPSAEELIAMIGKRVTISFIGRNSGEPITWSGTCRYIEASEIDNTPAISIMESTGKTRSARAHRLTSWTIH